MILKPSHLLWRLFGFKMAQLGGGISAASGTLLKFASGKLESCRRGGKMPTCDRGGPFVTSCDRF
jgi:hypothetical protein